MRAPSWELFRASCAVVHTCSRTEPLPEINEGLSAWARSLFPTLTATTWLVAITLILVSHPGPAKDGKVLLSYFGTKLVAFVACPADSSADGGDWI
jgi:hypothetical protein